MGSRIQVLSDSVIGKIAAGEVVERPASVVKELIENSIDAGADSIDIEIQDAGQTLIRIADNGRGIEEEDLRVALIRHSTSKITDVTDLDSLKTLGFRGEALASISAVSDLTITTSSGDSEGVSLYSEGGDVKELRPAPRSGGTTIEVKRLFYNVPARKKFLKKDNTEFAAIVDTVGRFVLSEQKTGFILKHGGRTILQASKDMKLKERISLVLGKDAAMEMVEIYSNTGKYEISGYISRPSNTRKDRYSQVFFVNNRYVRSTLIGNAISSAYSSMLERGKYPAAVLFISAEPSGVDVNIHPAKLLVKFADENGLRDSLKSAIICEFNRIRNDAAVSSASDSSPEDEVLLKAPVLTEDRGEQVNFDYVSSLEDGGGRKAVVSRDPLLSGTGRQLFQVGRCYIVEISDQKVTITDQHAAHERILYELFSRSIKGGAGEVQNLLFPVRIELSASGAVLMHKKIEDLNVLGFEIEHFGDNTFIVQAVPAILKDRDIKPVILDIVMDLGSQDKAVVEPIEELVKISACRAAIKAGDDLGEGEMAFLLDTLSECDLPFTCPHGRPVTFDLTVDELEKRFRRK